MSSDHKAPEPGLWTAWSITWLSLLLVSLVSVGVLARLSAGGAEDALAQALGDHLEAQAGLAAQHLQGAPVALLASLGGEHSADELEVRLEGLREAGSLHDLALVGPGEQVLGSGGDWLPLAAEADLVAQAATEGVRHGALYRAHGGELFMAAYAPVPGSPGWVLAVEGSGRTLGAVEALESRQAQAGLLVVLAAGLLGALVAGLVSLPVRDLARALGEAQPGEPPVRIPVRGPREVRSAAHAAQRLLGAILERDATIGEAHSREVEQLQRLAAEIAHEVRNPLNAMGLCAERLGSAGEPDVRRRLATRLQDQVGQLEAIVARLLDLTRPLEPEREPLALRPLAEAVGAELGLAMDFSGDPGGPFLADRVLLLEVLRNLFLNAREAGARSVRCHCLSTADQVTLDVSDDGPGITDVDRLFSWFHTTRAQGSGLGLPISRRIAEAHGGHLDLVDTHPATLRLTLPRSPA